MFLKIVGKSVAPSTTEIVVNSFPPGSIEEVKDEQSSPQVQTPGTIIMRGKLGPEDIQEVPKRLPKRDTLSAAQRRRSQQLYNVFRNCRKVGCPFHHRNCGQLFPARQY